MTRWKVLVHFCSQLAPQHGRAGGSVAWTPICQPGLSSLCHGPLPAPCKRRNRVSGLRPRDWPSTRSPVTSRPGPFSLSLGLCVQLPRPRPLGARVCLLRPRASGPQGLSPPATPRPPPATSLSQESCLRTSQTQDWAAGAGVQRVGPVWPRALRCARRLAEATPRWLPWPLAPGRAATGGPGQGPPLSSAPPGPRPCSTGQLQSPQGRPGGSRGIRQGRGRRPAPRPPHLALE